MKKRLYILFFILYSIFYIPSFSPVSAQYGQPIYNYSLYVDKTVANPYPADKGGNINCDSRYQYQDNYLPADISKRFKADQIVCFQLKVKNTSNVALTNVQARDTFPSYITPLVGPGAYDEATRTITFNADDFAINEEKVFFIKAIISSQQYLPADKGLFCLTNKADAWATNAYDDDYAQLCIEKQVTGVTTAPSAGPEMGILLIGGEITLLGLGIYLKKFKK